MLVTVRSQLGQDLTAMRLFQTFHEAKDCFFVEVGAFDGITFSNTKMLEEAGWNGICVEANPMYFKNLVDERPKTICVQSAVYSESGKVFDFIDCRDAMLSGLEIHLKNKELLPQNFVYSVTTKTLTEILTENNAPLYIHFLSIDTEGSDFEVLKGINFEIYSFGMISIEHGYSEPLRTNIRQLLTSNGYDYYRENHWDDDYVNKKIPKNILDLLPPVDKVTTK